VNKELDLLFSKHLTRLGVPKDQQSTAKERLLEFGDNVLAIESTNNYQAINPESGAKGGYQFKDDSVAPALTRLRRYVKPQSWMDEVAKNKDARTLTPDQQELLFFGDILDKTVQGETGRGDRYLKGIIGGDKESALRMYYEGHHTDPYSQEGTTARAMAQFGIKPVENKRSGGIVGNMNMQYEKGGMVNQAQGLAALGRGQDTELVHMTPSEVGGLQSLATQMGGSLSINPSTGLPEAGFFGDILPAIIGAGLFVGSGGAINPLTAGMLMGGGAFAASGGDLGQAAKYGLGGYGGAGLAGSLATAGGVANTTTALNTAGSAVPQATRTAAIEAAKKVSVPTMENFGGVFGKAGLEALKTDPYIKRRALAGLGGLAIGTEMDKMNQGVPKGSVTAQRDLDFYPEGGYTYDASGNVVQKNPNARNMFDSRGFYDYGAGFPMAQGGIVGYANGGLTAGPGDGMSDDIPAVIAGEQPAALSPGEFVVPADVVSDMGNGSSRAGARQLYSMMDRVRKARGGSVEQPEAINTRKMMPA
jgi:hypothetical protein